MTINNGAVAIMMATVIGCELWEGRQERKCFVCQFYYSKFHGSCALLFTNNGYVCCL